MATLFSTSSPITSLTFTPDNSGTFVEFTTFYLYGISSNTSTQNTTTPYATGGDVITTDGTYWYHAFKYSGAFTPLKNLSADVLVVAGGGGGGGYTGATTGVAGAITSGAGGGGSGYSGSAADVGGSGGSGLVIVRYAV